MQKLWLLKISWDETVPSNIASEWGKYRSNLVAVERINIPRCIVPSNVKWKELHGFCDSSEKAFAAAVYIRTITHNEEVHMHLLTSKTKVAPLKQVSLPRLELCGAVLLARLITPKCEQSPETQESLSEEPKLKGHERQVGFLTSAEMNNALLTLIRQEQRLKFSNEINLLVTKQEISNKSKLKCLNPFIDSNDLLRVGGRLRHSELPNNQKNPLVLPSQSLLTTLIVRDVHLSHLHAGPQLMLQALRQSYWILNGKNTVKYFYRKCVRCFRQNANICNQLMGDLPASRVIPSPAFSKCGVDFAGPFLLRVCKGRGQKRFKAYVCLFICFITRAIHLELVSDLSTPAFLATLKRFIGRRGKPFQIFSDCGTNFVGASRELRELHKFTNTVPHNEVVTRHLSQKGIEWIFNPPSAPHFGGLWEAGVRPLCPLSEDPNDLCALTPGHFLMGRQLTAIPEPVYSDVPSNRLSRWQLSEKVVQHFWRRWASEYLSRLQQRPKWMSSHPNIEVNSLVLLKDERLPKLQWKLGRIIAVHPGQDNKVRVVTVKTMEGLFKRPISKICILPIDTTATTTEDQL
ncbi:unnamed protein product [Allacma fusca]|uniref:Integrase catalytic domain-containing protein n=1 Tax=Allacma fusca TaxID=39272 RepID=A0A8J2NVY8_9HEXA|nr:unnamed protein product [Allacma fusca]